jgi:predicted acylesterase/phospholipase RssA
MADRGVDVNSLAGLSTGAIVFTLTSAGLLTNEEAQAGGLQEFLDTIQNEEEQKESRGIMALGN